MPQVKFIIHLLDVTFSGLWALIVVDLMPFMGSIPVVQGTLDSIDSGIKVLMSFGGFIYFIVRTWFYAQHQIVELSIKKEELNKIRTENKSEV